MNLLAGDLGGTKTILAVYSNESYPKKLFNKYYISSKWKSFNSIFVLTGQSCRWFLLLRILMYYQDEEYLQKMFQNFNKSLNVDLRALKVWKNDFSSQKTVFSRSNF